MAKNNLEAEAEVTRVSWIIPQTPKRKALREVIKQRCLDYVESEKRAYEDSRPIGYALGVV